MYSYFGIGSIERTVTVLQKHKAKQRIRFIKLIDGQNHSDKEKPHMHLLSTHFYIRDYKTSFVNRPRQLVATVCF